jgi:N-acetyl-anhydromuramyl-L-alanine amidase AmpD
MAVRSCRVGLHGRNAELFQEVDYQVVRQAHIETLKMMSLTKPEVFKRLQSENSGIEFIVRLWDDRMGTGHHPTPEQFVERMAPLMDPLRPYATKFEIHNEPNHLQRYEGWGQEDADARDFNTWYQQVFKLLKARCPWAMLGFPGLAIPHRDLEWVEICRPSVELSDFLCVHCYWQTTPDQPRNHLVDFWGLRFKYYHDKFPTKTIDLTEVGNSNAQGGLAINDQEIAKQYLEYFQELFNYSYVNSADPFILSSPDSTWDSFAWRKASGEIKPVVAAIGAMSRPTLQPAQAKPVVRERFFEITQQTVSGPFLDFFDKYGLDICGYPISAQFDDGGIQVQYFQRVVPEEFQPGQIRLRLAGTDVMTLRQRGAELEATIAQLQAQAQAGGVVLFTPPTITDISGQLPQHPTKRYPTRPAADINTIVIHHTAVPASVGPERIASALISNRDLPGISYHYFVAADGTLYQTQPLTALTQHAYQFSAASVGVAFAGDFTDAIPTSQQLQAGGQLCAYLMRTLNISRDAIKGLSELVTHQSPGRQWLQGQKWKDMLLAQVDQALTAAPVSGQVASLQARIADLEKQLAAARSAADAAGARIADLEKQLAAVPPQPAGAGGVAQPAIEDISGTLPQHPTARYQTRPVSAIQSIVLHHSAVPASVGAAQIAKYQVDKQGWPGIGFHYFVTDDGHLQQTQPLEVIAYHAGDANNPSSLGICLAGNFTDQPPSAAELAGTSQLVAWLLYKLNLPVEAIHAHKDYIATACPGNQWDNGARWGDQFRQQVQDALAGVGAAAPGAGVKALGHYMLFWQTVDDWARDDFLGAQTYIGRFRVTAGFSVDDAKQAEYVTIVGGPLGVSPAAESLLRTAGCKVERVAGATTAETKQLLDQMAQQGKRFLTFPNQ